MDDYVIIFPTDTVYGIGTGLYDLKGIKRIYDLKGRDFNKPLAVLVNNVTQIEQFAIVDSKTLLLARQFWPGGLTIVLNTKVEYYKLTNEKTIAVRIPNHKLALELLKEHGPLKTTSVNDSGSEPLNDYRVIYDKYKGIVERIYENNENISKVSSTVVDLTNGLKIIREGNISKDDILEVLKSL